MSAELTNPPEVEIVEATEDRLDEIEPLWRAMHDSDVDVAAAAHDVVPLRETGPAWSRRRDELAAWMRSGDGRLLIAERDGSPVGFAFFRIRTGDRSFETGERVGELEALSVTPELRRWGVGSLLMEEVEQRLVDAGVGHVGLAVIVGNEDALRFYERWGIVPSHVRCLGRTLPRDGEPA